MCSDSSDIQAANVTLTYYETLRLYISPNTAWYNAVFEYLQSCVA